MMKLILTIVLLSMISAAAYATSVTVTQTKLQSNSGVLQKIYYETVSGPGSTTPSVNTALTPSGSSGSYSIAAGTSGYLWSPSFSSATTIPASRMTFDIWAATVPASFGLDGSASGNSGGGATISVSLTTTKSNDILYLSVVESGGFTVSSITSSPSLTWTQRASVLFSSTRHLETWYAVWSTSGTNTITITLSGSTNAAAVAFGISGANTVSPFDSHAGIPTSASGTAGTSASVTISTANSNDFIIGALGVQSNPALTTGTGFTLILTSVVGTSRETSDEYQLGTTTQTNLAVGYTWSGAQDWAIVADAIVAATPISITLRTTNSLGTLVSTLLSTTNTNPILTSETETSTVYSISSGSIPSGGYLEVVLTAPSSTSVTVYWGVGQPTNFQVPGAVES